LGDIGEYLHPKIVAISVYEFVNSNSTQLLTTISPLIIAMAHHLEAR